MEDARERERVLDFDSTEEEAIVWECEADLEEQTIYWNDYIVEKTTYPRYDN